jgi:hypothetical protein
MKGQMVRKNVTTIHTEIGKISSNKIKAIWPKTGQYLIKYKEAWERVVKKNDERDGERKR